ncbi:hypothetical protein [Streptomyces sp. NPDC018045]|uniref:hypothetical protein n=1 Tax=Streptomyces sp. NPDC018045 TaxID=3365037 RepID=UPI0037A9D086
MTRRHRVGLAAVSVLPTLIAVLLCAVLAAAGVLPWAVVPAVLPALAVQGCVTYVRLGARPAGQPGVRPPA